jgi:hypothetical protein
MADIYLRREWPMKHLVPQHIRPFFVLLFAFLGLYMFVALIGLWRGFDPPIEQILDHTSAYMEKVLWYLLATLTIESCRAHHWKEKEP